MNHFNERAYADEIRKKTDEDLAAELDVVTRKKKTLEGEMQTRTANHNRSIDQKNECLKKEIEKNERQRKR